MAFIRAFGGGGIPSALKSAMNAVLNKKFGTSTTYAPEDWPEDVNLLGPLPEKTASGSIAHIEDGADTVPIKTWDVTVDANLDGVSSIKVTQAGKNLVDGSNFTKGLPATTIGSSINTISSSDRYSYFGCDIKGGSYNISSVSYDSDYYNAILIFGYSGGFLSVYTAGVVNGNKTVDLSACDYVRVCIGTRSVGYSVPTDFSSYGTIQLEIGSYTSYEPYTAPTVTTVSLGRTIYGGNADVVNGTGTEAYNVIRLDSLNFIKNNTQNNPNGTYFSLDGVSVPFLGWGSGGRDSALSNVLTPGSAGADGQTEPNNTFWWNNASTGWRVVWGSPNGGSSLDDFMTFLTENNVVVGGALQDAEKTDFTFTPMTPIPDTALGVNNFWSDEGDSEVTYRADINLALAANSSRGLMMASRPVTQLIGEESDLNQVNELVEDDENDETEQEGDDDENIRQDPADR